MTALAILRALWGFLRSPLGQVLALAVGGVLLLSRADARGYRRGSEAVQAKWDAKIAADAVKARATEVKNTTTGVRIEGEAKAAQVEIRWRTKTLKELVPVYVPTDLAGPGLPVGFVRLHRAATSGLPIEPHPAGLSDEAASGIGLPVLASLDIENAGRCLAEIDRFARLQQWVRETR